MLGLGLSFAGNNVIMNVIMGCAVTAKKERKTRGESREKERVRDVGVAKRNFRFDRLDERRLNGVEPIWGLGLRGACWGCGFKIWPAACRLMGALPDGLLICPLVAVGLMSKFRQ